MPHFPVKKARWISGLLLRFSPRFAHKRVGSAYLTILLGAALAFGVEVFHPLRVNLLADRFRREHLALQMKRLRCVHDFLLRTGWKNWREQRQGCASRVGTSA